MDNEQSPTKKTNLSRRQLLKYGIYGGLAAGLSSSLWLSGCGKKRPVRRPNIILILIDTLRADRLGAYGHPGGYTPTLDSIAAESVIFNRAIAQSSWTLPSVASLFCSYYPSVHKLHLFQEQKMADPKGTTALTLNTLGQSFTTLAEALQKGGYQTAAFVANPWTLPKLGFAQGFEHYDAGFADNTTPGNLVNEAALRWLGNRDPDRPFFCYLHYMDVHGPYKARPGLLEPLVDKVEAQPDKQKLSEQEIDALGYLYQMPESGTDIERHKKLSVYREYWAARYDSGVRQIDEYIKGLKEQLERMGLWNDAYVTITSDHGEELLEHGFWNHGYSLHNTELHVPLFLRWPGVLRSGKRVRRAVQLIDVMPTLIEQLSLPKVKGLQGRSLAGEIAAPGSGKPVVAFAEGAKIHQQRAIYLDDWKLIIITQQEGSWLQLYNISSDPLEQNELSQTHKKELMRLVKALQYQSMMNEKQKDFPGAGTVSLTPEEEKRLRSLGYVE